MFHSFGGQEQDKELGQDQDKDLPITKNEPLADALDRSTHELQLLANFYHQHSYPERAQEIYQTILKIRLDRDQKRD
jgi:hypothetical protein